MNDTQKLASPRGWLARLVRHLRRVWRSPYESQWVPITERLPSVGDVIACAAEHSEGGMMVWAGTVTEIWEQGCAVMETRGERTHSFVITHDTLWTILPFLPNDEMRESVGSAARKNGCMGAVVLIGGEDSAYTAIEDVVRTYDSEDSSALSGSALEIIERMEREGFVRRSKDWLALQLAREKTPQDRPDAVSIQEFADLHRLTLSYFSLAEGYVSCFLVSTAWIPVDVKKFGNLSTAYGKGRTKAQALRAYAHMISGYTIVVRESEDTHSDVKVPNLREAG